MKPPFEQPQLELNTVKTDMLRCATVPRMVGLELRATSRAAKVIMYESGAHACTTPTSGAI